MRFVRVNWKDRLDMRIDTIVRFVTGKQKAMVAGVVYRGDVNKYVGDDLGADFRAVVKSSVNDEWYTVDKNETEDSFNKLMRADAELATELDKIDFRNRQMSQVNVVE